LNIRSALNFTIKKEKTNKEMEIKEMIHRGLITWYLIKTMEKLNNSELSNILGCHDCTGKGY
jgi:hypothetical protein